MEEILKSLAGGSVPGAILAFALWKIAPAIAAFQEEIRRGLRGIEQAQYESAKADLLRLIASPHVSSDVKEHAASIVREIEPPLKAILAETKKENETP